MTSGDVRGGPVVKISLSNAGDTGSVPGRGAKIPHASWSKTQNMEIQKNEDGGGIGWADHFLPHKFIKRTFKR